MPLLSLSRGTRAPSLPPSPRGSYASVRTDIFVTYMDAMKFYPQKFS